MHKTADISKCKRYRYSLTRSWDDRPRFTFIMLNPSTADATHDDPTIKKCIGFAKKWQAGGITVVNLYAYRATKPRDLRAARCDIVGPRNFDAISSSMKDSWGGVCAWGANAYDQDHINKVLSLINGPLWCLGTTKSGQPRHPLMLSYATRLEKMKR